VSTPGDRGHRPRSCSKSVHRAHVPHAMITDVDARASTRCAGGDALVADLGAVKQTIWPSKARIGRDSW